MKTLLTTLLLTPLLLTPALAGEATIGIMVELIDEDAERMLSGQELLDETYGENTYNFAAWEERCCEAKRLRHKITNPHYVCVTIEDKIGDC